MTEREKMLSGRLYWAGDPELCEARDRAKRLTWRYNQMDPTDWDGRTALLRELLGRLGEDSWIEPSFRCDYGTQISLGDHVFINYDCIFLDVAPITVGDHAMLAPRVCLYTASHPTDAGVRNDSGLEYGLPITIGEGAWLGGNVSVLPGVTIGANTIIAAGSVVHRDMPPNVIAGGNPCRVIRPIGEVDRIKWQGAQRQHEEP